MPLELQAECGCTADDIAGRPRVDTRFCQVRTLARSLALMQLENVEYARSNMSLEQAQIVLTDGIRELVRAYLRAIDRDQIYASVEYTEELRLLVEQVTSALAGAADTEPWVSRALALGIPAGVLMSPPPPPPDWVGAKG